MSLRTIYAHGDLDGIICALIVSLRYPSARVMPKGGRSLADIRDFPAAILDLALPPHHPALRATDNLWIDHHRLGPDFDRSRVRCRMKHDPLHAAAVTTLGYARETWGDRISEETGRRLERWARLADVADRFVTEDARHPYARALNVMLRLGGWAFFWRWLVDGDTCRDPEESPFPELVAFAGEVEGRQNDRAFAVFLDTMRDLSDWVLGVLPAGSPAEVGERLQRYLDRTVGLVLPPAPGSEVVKVAIRGPNADLIARRYGGDGHPRAAGFRLPRESFRYVFQLPMEEEQRIAPSSPEAPHDQTTGTAERRRSGPPAGTRGT